MNIVLKTPSKPFSSIDLKIECWAENLYWACLKKISIENIAKLYFYFLGQDLPGFQTMEGLNARTKFKSIPFS
jgi:hypothetical protein